MKVYLVALLAVSLMGIGVANATTIGKVNIHDVMDKIAEGQKIKKELETKVDGFKKELAKDEANLQKLQTDFQKQSLVMNESTKMKKQEDMQKIYFDYRQKRDKYEKDIVDLEQKLKTPVLEKLKEIIETVSAAASVDMTFETTSTPLLYSKVSKDLTDDVVKAYDKKYPSKK